MLETHSIKRIELGKKDSCLGVEDVRKKLTPYVAGVPEDPAANTTLMFPGSPGWTARLDVLFESGNIKIDETIGIIRSDVSAEDSSSDSECLYRPGALLPD